ncbi:MAG: alanine racemase [Thermodesulfovibrionales bacterium]|nr:alanine racemase [Thermodesulfovibrionales bacterium]
MNRGAQAEIDLAALSSNLSKAKKITGGLPVIAVVKADAYGHGAVEVSRRLLKEGIRSLAVAFIEEAAELREAGINAPILVLFDRSDIGTCFDLNLTPVVHDIKSAKAFSKEARKRGCVIDVHIKADTGMGRMGFGSIEEITDAAELPNLRIAGLMSHFSESDPSETEYANLQLKKFLEIKTALSDRGFKKPLCHMANSASMLNFKDSHLDAVRPGLFLYLGAHSGGATPVMRVSTTVLALRKLKKGCPVSYGRTFITTRATIAAVLPVGYADGYMRTLSNKSCVILKGRRAPVIGRVCMDLTMVDVTDIKGVKEGQRVTLIGSEGGETITAGELGGWASTIPYEILTSLGSRSKRVYTGRA